jgi:hypothetical protein
MPGPQEPPPVPQRGPRKHTLPGVAVPPPPVQAPRGEAFDDDEPDTAPAAPHALSASGAPPRPSNPPPPDLAHRQSYADLAHEAAIALALAQDRQERLDALQSADLERQRLKPRLDAPSEPPRRRSHAVLKALGVILGGLLVTVSGYFGIGAKTQLEPKVDAAKAVQVATAADLKAAVDRIDKLEDWKAREVKHRDCVERQVRDFADRLGHDMTSLTRGGTEWAEQNKPPARQSIPWVKPTWFTTENCPTAPP